jgi:hypothetical protein
VTIPQVFKEQQPLVEHTKDWHTEVRQKIIDGIAQLPGAPTFLALSGFASIKLANQALTLFTAQNPHGVLGPDDDPVHLEQLLYELQMSTPSRYQSDAIHRSINKKLEFIESELSAQGLSQDREHHFPALSSNSSPVAVGL